MEEEISMKEENKNPYADSYKWAYEFDQEIAKHKKLLNRAVGNQIIPHINYHHYEIVRLIREKEKIEIEKQKELRKLPVVGVITERLSNQLNKISDFILIHGEHEKPTL